MPLPLPGLRVWQASVTRQEHCRGINSSRTRRFLKPRPRSRCTKLVERRTFGGTLILGTRLGPGRVLAWRRARDWPGGHEQDEHGLAGVQRRGQRWLGMTALAFLPRPSILAQSRPAPRLRLGGGVGEIACRSVCRAGLWFLAARGEQNLAVWSMYLASRSKQVLGNPTSHTRRGHGRLANLGEQALLTASKAEKPPAVAAKRPRPAS